MLTLYEFNALDEPGQADVLQERGVVVGLREEGVYVFILYQIHSFYVEGWWHKHEDRLTGYRSFNDTELLEPYLNQINLTPVF